MAKLTIVKILVLLLIGWICCSEARGVWGKRKREEVTSTRVPPQAKSRVEMKEEMLSGRAEGTDSPRKPRPPNERESSSFEDRLGDRLGKRNHQPNNLEVEMQLQQFSEIFDSAVESVQELVSSNEFKNMIESMNSSTLEQLFETALGTLDKEGLFEARNHLNLLIECGICRPAVSSASSQ